MILLIISSRKRIWRHRWCYAYHILYSGHVASLPHNWHELLPYMTWCVQSVQYAIYRQSYCGSTDLYRIREKATSNTHKTSCISQSFWAVYLHIFLRHHVTLTFNYWFFSKLICQDNCWGRFRFGFFSLKERKCSPIGKTRCSQDEDITLLT